MPNLGRRITKAAEESAKATQRIVVAEQKIARAFLDMMRDDEEEQRESAGRAAGGNPSEKQPPRK